MLNSGSPSNVNDEEINSNRIFEIVLFFDVLYQFQFWHRFRDDKLLLVHIGEKYFWNSDRSRSLQLLVGEEIIFLPANARTSKPLT